jgi:hypothetical protein
MRILIQSPSSAVAWGTYETFKRIMMSPKYTF